jgi:hypothetical protein
MKRPCDVLWSEAPKTGDAGGVISVSLKSSRSEDRGRAKSPSSGVDEEASLRDVVSRSC